MMDWKTIVGFTILFHGIVYAWRREWVLRMDTRKLNSPLNSIGQHGIRKFFRAWFRVGTYATIIIGFPFTIFLFLRTIYYAFFPSIVAVALAVTPSSLLSSVSVEPPLELHQPPLSPYPDADILIEDLPMDSHVSQSQSQGSDSSSGDGYLAIQPILPGWNLPISHLPYYLLAILISVVIHELGHAIASSSHKIPIQSVGLSIFGPLIPAAHVELNSLQLRETPIRKQLDILTAGVWMNLYLAVITYFVVPKLLPGILYPTHTLGRGISVVTLWPNSGVGGPGGLDPGDIIVGIENCPVYDLNSWSTCLEKIWESDPVGYCVTNDTLVKFANNSEGCCGSEGDNSLTHLCFLQMDDWKPPSIALDASPGHLRNESKTKTHSGKSKSNATSDDHDHDNSSPHNHHQNETVPGGRRSYCLPAQPVVSLVAPPPLSPTQDKENEGDGESESEIEEFLSWEGRCHSPIYSCAHYVATLTPENQNQNTNTPHPSEDGENQGQDEDASVPTPTAHCFLPRLVHDLKRFRIVQIQRHQSSGLKSPVLFIGNVYDLFGGIRSSDYVPREWWLSRWVGFSSFAKLPERLETVLLLTAGLSAGLAVVNMLPIYGLDGYHIVEAVARSYLTKKWEPRRISRLIQGVSWIAMGIAILTVFCSVAQAL